ncbi:MULTISPECIES: hypothetical protein [unclassified Frankia]|uniref:hypothetical protein n=1 Tax=unclassified Frankia TaxID=2632575 RepID=UPI001EF5AD46|nr:MULTISPECIES: hypothetical protein [unclassified Frankia]
MTSQDVPDTAPRARARRSPEPAAARLARALVDRRHRRWVLLGGLAFAALAAFGVYASVAGPPPRIEAVVYFTPTATDAQKDAVRAACPTAGQAVQEARDHNTAQSSRVYPLRYNVTYASPADKAMIYRCVHAQPNVIGISEFTAGE